MPLSGALPAGVPQVPPSVVSDKLSVLGAGLPGTNVTFTLDDDPAFDVEVCGLTENPLPPPTERFTGTDTLPVFTMLIGNIALLPTATLPKARLDGLQESTAPFAVSRSVVA